MFANMKHWVAMGGAGWAAAATGTPTVGLRLSAAAAGAGIWRPVPERIEKQQGLSK